MNPDPMCEVRSRCRLGRALLQRTDSSRSQISFARARLLVVLPEGDEVVSTGWDLSETGDSLQVVSGHGEGRIVIQTDRCAKARQANLVKQLLA